MIRKPKSKPPAPTEWIANQTRCAEEIARHFRISCTKQSIQNWQKKFDPPFPAPAPGGSRYNRAECYAWVEKHIISAKGSRLTPEEFEKLLADAQIAEAQAKIRKEQILSREWEAVQGKYIEQKLADRTIIGALKHYHGIVRAELERNLTDIRRDKLRALNVAEDVITLFYAADLELAKATIDKIEVECEKAGA